MKVLVTGATGFVGSHLITKLMGIGFEVRALVRKTSNIKKLRDLKVELAYGDILDKQAVRKAVNGVEKVFHLATTMNQQAISDTLCWKINVEGTKNLLESSVASKVSHFVHCSTAGFLKHIPGQLIDEMSPCDADTVYEKSKAEGEKLVKDYGRDKGLRVSIIRPGPVYGPGDIHHFLKLFRWIKKKILPIFGNGNNLIHPVYIDDLIEGFVLVTSKEIAIDNTYIIAGNKTVTLNEFVATIASELQLQPLKIFLPVIPFRLLIFLSEVANKSVGITPPIKRSTINFFVKSKALDISKARIELGYNPKVDLQEGVRKTVIWYHEFMLL